MPNRISAYFFEKLDTDSKTPTTTVGKKTKTKAKLRLGVVITGKIALPYLITLAPPMHHRATFKV